MMKYYKLLFSMMITGTFLVSCEKEDVIHEEAEAKEHDKKVSKDILEQVSSLHLIIRMSK